MHMFRGMGWGTLSTRYVRVINYYTCYGSLFLKLVEPWLGIFQYNRKSKLPLTVVYLLLLYSPTFKMVGGLSIPNKLVHALSMATFSSVRC